MRRVFGVVFCMAVGLSGFVWAEVQHFQSPSGNILCEINADPDSFVRCDLGVDRQTYTERPASCEGSWGRSFVVAERGRGFLNCAVDAIDAPDEPTVLPYGVALELEAITCLSETTGMTCTNADGGGFSVRRAEQRIF